MRSTYLLFLFFLIGTITPALAQEKMVARDGFKEGYRAVQFGIGNNFRLTQFDDTHFSYLRFKSDNKALFIRGNFNFNYSDNSNEVETESDFENDLNDDISYKDENSSTGISGSAKVYLGSTSYHETKSDVLPYFSKSLFFGITLAKYKEDRSASEIEPTPEVDQERDSKNIRIVPLIGATASFGVEYFISKNISLLAQSGFEINYSYLNENYTLNDKDFSDGEVFRHVTRDSKNNLHRWNLNSTGVIFGLTAYF